MDNPILKAHLEGVGKFDEKFVLETNNGKILSCKHLGKNTIIEDLLAFLTTYGTNLLKAAKEAGPGECNSTDYDYAGIGLYTTPKGYCVHGHNSCLSSFTSVIDEGIKGIENN